MSDTHQEWALASGYKARRISYQDYLEACARLEDQIFGEYFTFNLDKALDASQRERLAALKSRLPHGEQYCFGIYTEDDELIGWQYSAQAPGGEICMKDTGILPAHQRRGIYRALLPRLLELFRAQGYVAATSLHRTTNNAVIIPKLQAGFLINGLQTDESGQSVVLIHPFHADHREVLRVRSGERRPSGRIATLLGL